MIRSNQWLKCAGCPTLIEWGDLCCDQCWKRLPFHLKLNYRTAKHLKSRWPQFMVVELKILVWLFDHRIDHVEFKPFP